MLISEFEYLKTRYEFLLESGYIRNDDILIIGELIFDIQDLIDDNELFFRVNELKEMINELEFKLNYL